MGEHAAADFFAVAFDTDPRLHDSCVDPRRHRFLAQLLETPEYRELHTATRLDDTASEIAATHFARQFADLTKPAPAGVAENGELNAEMATLRAVGKALAAAREEIGELQDAAAAFGMGAGGPGANDPQAVAALSKRVRSDPALKRIRAIQCGLPGLATLAQEHLDRAIEARTGSDATRVIQRLFDRHADLFPIRPQGGCYFIPDRHTPFVDKVHTFLGRIHGELLRFPVPAGTARG